MLYILHRLENTSQVRGRVFIYCNILKAVKKSANKSSTDIKSATGNDAVVMIDIKDILPKIDSTIEMTWAKGHYNGPEKHIKYKLNQIAHNAAVGFLKTIHKEYTPLQHPL
jgi:hypothetical protein